MSNPFCCQRISYIDQWNINTQRDVLLSWDTDDLLVYVFDVRNPSNAESGTVAQTPFNASYLLNHRISISAEQVLKDVCASIDTERNPLVVYYPFDRKAVEICDLRELRESLRDQIPIILQG